jgi:hypothetical protein
MYMNVRNIPEYLNEAIFMSMNKSQTLEHNSVMVKAYKMFHKLFIKSRKKIPETIHKTPYKTSRWPIKQIYIYT